MALVNPNIAMSFRQPEFTPRNALAEYAQIQQIQGGQRQAEVADMQLRRMRQEDEDIERIHQIAMKNGGPDSRMEMGRALFASRNNEQRQLGYKILQHEEAVRAYNSEFGPGAMAAPAMPSSAPGAMAAPSAPATPPGELVAAPITPPTGVMREIAPGGAMGAEMPLTRGAPANALAFAAPAPANALAPTAPAAPNIDALRRQYGMAVAAGKPYAPVLLKQIEAALKPDPSELRTMRELGYSLTPEGYREFRLAQMNVQDGALVPIVGPDGRPRYATRAQAAGQIPFTPAAVQVLGMGPQQGPAARGAAPAAPSAPAGKPPTPAQVAKDKRMEEARTALSKDIETQLKYYSDLNDLGAMVTSAGPNASVAGNVTAFTRSTDVGQKVERALGTKAQTLRDNIKNTRQRLFMQIKDATGATASQMNSNVEMQAWLNSMTDPQQSIETVQETLKQLDSVIAGVRSQVEQEQAGKKSPAKSAPTAPATPTAAPPLPQGFTLDKK